MSLELLGTTGCHLCEQAEGLVQATLGRIDPLRPLVLIEIADDPTLMDAYGIRIPVLRHEDQELCWPFTQDDVLHFLSALNAEPHLPRTPENRS